MHIQVVSCNVTANLIPALVMEEMKSCVRGSLRQQVTRTLVEEGWEEEEQAEQAGTGLLRACGKK